MRKPEAIANFIARMAGREFSSGDIATCCGVSLGEVRRVITPYVKTARVIRTNKNGDDELAMWKATGL